MVSYTARFQQFQATKNPADQFWQQEWQGYTEQCPEYRIARVTYFDRAGQVITDLPSTYCSYPVTQGLPCLENHLKNGLALQLPPPVLEFLATVTTSAIAAAHISSADLSELLERILAVAATRHET
ncbi:MAG: hypothetical protein SFT94_10615 [Pseudanabaenaceae cyanobacterium bins.68]|nr:hypothetical protein [Pseudanabaenaceae cyanobacterium bins.68]